MDIEELFKRLDNYLNSILSTYSISNMYKNKILESIKLIKCHIDILDQEKPLPEYDSQGIKTCIFYLQILVSEIIVDDLLKQFCYDYCFLVQNWNNNVLKDDSLSKQIDFIIRKTHNNITFFETRDLLKHLTTKLEKQLEWRPPAFELSDHYYKLLKEK